MEIILKTGEKVLIDAEDYEKVKKYNWFILSKPNGYFTVVTAFGGWKKRTFIRIHRLIMNAPEGTMIDHINGNNLDNRKKNLRFVTNAQNLWNQKSRGGKSKYKGVAWIKQKKRWRATIGTNGLQKTIGDFDNEKDAARSYDRWAIKLRGEYARLNFPKQRRLG